MQTPSLFRSTAWVPFLLFGGVCVIGVGMIRGASSVEGYVALIKSKDVLEGTVGQLAQENAELQNEILKLRESPSYARKVLRDKYHVTDQGENIVFFAE